MLDVTVWIVVASNVLRKSNNLYPFLFLGRIKKTDFQCTIFRYNFSMDR